MAQHSDHDNYKVIHSTKYYEIGRRGDTLVAACLCGSGRTWRNKGDGKTAMATWRTQHQHVNGLENS